MIAVIVILFFISFCILVNFLFTKEIYTKLMTFYYFSSTLIQVIFLYCIFTYKFAYIINLVYLLLLLNFALVLFFVKNFEKYNI